MPANARVILSRAILPIAGYWSLLLALSIRAQSPTGSADFLPSLVILGLPLVILASVILLRDAHASGVVLALRDELTGVGNRRAFMTHAQLLLRNAKPGSVGLIMLDVDDLKQVNDKCGHQAGDELLTRVANRLSGSGKLFRVGGDEFAILIDRTSGEHMSHGMLALEPTIERFDFCDHEHEVKVSFGAASNHENETLEDLFKRADDSLLLRKQTSRDARRQTAERDLMESRTCEDPPPRLKLLS